MAGRRMSPKQMQEAARKRVSDAYYATCSGVQISVLDMGKVMNVGLTAVAEGVDDATLQQRVKEYVETIRKN